jgi:hypothetical protein
LKRALGVVVLVVIGAWATTASAALTPIEVVRYVMTNAPGKMPQKIQCVTREELLRGDGRNITNNAIGITIRKGNTATVLLDWAEVCTPLHRFRTGRRVEPAAVINAMSTVLHEKAHVQRIRTEWKATCWAIPGVARQLRAWGYTARQVAAAKWYLVHFADRGRSGEYKLRGRCDVGVSARPPVP